DEPHITLKLLTRRIHQRKPFVDPISDAPTLAETIHGADLSSWNPNPSQQDFLSSPKVFLILDVLSSLFKTKPVHVPSETARNLDQLAFAKQTARVRGLSVPSWWSGSTLQT
ncbi:hypothetical protein IGI04_035110, partial [Brassica rapa subsp. trilocularis]